ncbi:MAG: tRNA epoxyqueuosine(34) reductase QueG [Planctomycetaceae bacterium]|nr:tRNA epoxyqueuosine(34) reductase QueG [Planctomycetaceae bacterium]
MNLSENIKAKAIQIGFDVVGITASTPLEKDRSYFEDWLAAGRAGKMGYLRRNVDKRFDPQRLLNGARSVICTAVQYQPAAFEGRDYRIAAFALYEDYHLAIRQRLLELADYIQMEIGGSIGFKACVDSVPLAERALAKRAGLGFIGRNRMLTHPELGSRLLLGELITTARLEPDSPMERGGCGDCRQCIDHCPAGALTEGDFDPRRCISCLTIEEADISLPEQTGLSNYLFGCDECLNACPYNRQAASGAGRILKKHPEWLNLTRQEISDFTQEQFERFFAGSGLFRLGLERLKRNCRCR